jgi:hypothetical protein
MYPATEFWTSLGFHPRISCPEKKNPPLRADFSISLSGFNYEIQSMVFVWFVVGFY